MRLSCALRCFRAARSETRDAPRELWVDWGEKGKSAL